MNSTPLTVYFNSKNYFHFYILLCSTNKGVQIIFHKRFLQKNIMKESK